MRFALIISFLLLSFNACAPRGETKTLEEILANSKQRYEATQNVQIPDAAKSGVVTATKDMERALTLSASNELAPVLSEIGSTLQGLVASAGFTSRPAMNELAMQFRNLGAGDAASSDQVKLLVARTYTLLASELETSAFRYSSSG